MNISGVGQGIQTGTSSPVHFAHAAQTGTPSRSNDSISSGKHSDKELANELKVIEQLLTLLLSAIGGQAGQGSGNNQGSQLSGASDGSDGADDGASGADDGSGDSDDGLGDADDGGAGAQSPSAGGGGSAPPSSQPAQQATQSAPAQQSLVQQPNQGTQPNPTQQISSAPQQSLVGQPTGNVQGSGTGTGAAATAPVGGIDTTSKTGQREDVLIGSYTDPQDLANPGNIAKNPRVGLWLTQLGYDQSIPDASGRDAVANAWQGKGYSLERGTYSGGYGNANSGGLNQQFTQYTNGKENLNTQTADLGDEDGVVSNADVSSFESDLQSQRANGQNLLPVYGPNSATGTPGNFQNGFASSDFDNFRKVAKAAGGFVLDSPPSILANPAYAKWYQDATKWAHANGLKTEWYAAPGEAQTNSSQYLAGVKSAVQMMNETGTNPDTYILGNYDQNNPAATVQTEEQAAQIVLNNTTPTS